MVPPNWTQPFHVFMDAFDKAVGSILMQEQRPSWFCLIYYASRRLSLAKWNYSIIKREHLGMIYFVKRFWHYLLGRLFYFHVDHFALLYLVKQQNLTGQLAQWMLLLQEFDFLIIHTPGKEHSIADFLNRVESRESPKGIPNHLPDAELFEMQGLISDSWYDQLLIFLTDGVLPEKFTTDQRRKFALKNKPFLVIAGALYRK